MRKPVERSRRGMGRLPPMGFITMSRKAPRGQTSHQARPRQKETPTAGLDLRTDSEFTSYKGMVGFQQGSMVLDGLSRQKVAELAPQARDAERVRLRGRVATTQLSEDMKKLAVGRAYAVKVEFVKHDVDKAKIRILSPQQSSGENATGSVRGVDVMMRVGRES